MVNGDGKAHTTYHSQPNCSVSPHDEHDGTSVRVDNFSTEWHEYAAQFSPTEAVFYVDGQVVLDVPKCEHVLDGTYICYMLCVRKCRRASSRQHAARPTLRSAQRLPRARRLKRN